MVESLYSEEWKEINGYEGKYLISTHGRVLSIRRKIPHNNKPGMKTIPEKILKIIADGEGYSLVGLSKDGKRRMYKVHQLVASHFVEERPSPQHGINHKDGVKSNNHYTNLEWTTIQENIDHAVRNGLRRKKNNNELIMLTGKSLEELRRKQYEKQNGICAILGIKIDYKDAVMDHKHKLKSEECGGPEGLGCCRGVIHRNANSFEGKLDRLRKRYGLKDIIGLTDLLRNCIRYIECPPMEPIYVHPSEKPKRPKLSKVDYNRIKKYWPKMFPKRKLLPYPKDSIMTAKWVDMLNQANILHARTKKGRIKRIRS